MVGADPLASALQLDLEPPPSDDAVLHFRGSPPTARLSLRNNTAQLHGFVIAPRVGAPAAGVVFSPRSGLVQPDATVDVEASLASTGISNGPRLAAWSATSAGYFVDRNTQGAQIVSSMRPKTYALKI